MDHGDQYDQAIFIETASMILEALSCHIDDGEAYSNGIVDVACKTDFTESTTYF